MSTLVHRCVGYGGVHHILRCTKMISVNIRRQLNHGSRAKLAASLFESLLEEDIAIFVNIRNIDNATLKSQQGKSVIASSFQLRRGAFVDFYNRYLEK